MADFSPADRALLAAVRDVQARPPGIYAHTVNVARATGRSVADVEVQLRVLEQRALVRLTLWGSWDLRTAGNERLGKED